MRLLIGAMPLLLIVGIAATAQSVNSSGKSIIPCAKNITNQTNCQWRRKIAQLWRDKIDHLS
jgi:hypothetical protein